jgi:hypothetical protein
MDIAEEELKKEAKDVSLPRIQGIYITYIYMSVYIDKEGSKGR